MNEKNISILIVDDEEDICEILKYNIESEGFLVETALSAEEALQKDLSKYQLFLLDVMMGAMSGYKLANEIRKNLQIEVPIIFLTAKISENDKLTGFSVGADDYITKPFSIREVVARIKAVLRRFSSKETKKNDEEILKVSGIELNISKKCLLIDNVKVDLTPREYQIIYLLLKNEGKIFSRDEILHFAWENDTYVVDRTVDVHITRLRKKLKNYGKHIVSRTGYGYCFEIE